MDVFTLFGNPQAVQAPLNPQPWYPGAKLDLDDYGEILIRILPTGRHNAIDARVLARLLNMPPERTEHPLRKLMRDLTMRKGWPIGSVSIGTRRGYYLIDSDEDAQHYAQNLRHRAKAIEARRVEVLDGWEKRKASKAAGGRWPAP